MPWFRRGPTLAEYAADYLVTAKPRLAPLTYERQESVVRIYVTPLIGGKRLAAITRPDVRGFIAKSLEAGLKPSTVRQNLTVVQAIFGQAVEDGLIPANPAAGPWKQYRLRHQAPPRHLTEDQLRALSEPASGAGPHLDVFVGLLWRTGLRRGEALALRWEDVDLSKATLHVHDTLLPGRGLAGQTKTGRDRVVDLSPAAVGILTRHRAWSREEALRVGLGHPPGWVFWGRTGGPIAPVTIQHQFKRLCRGAGLPEGITLHCLRHTFATLLARNGVSPSVAQK
ncbi:hypothetical protein LCGC14_2685520, partial [marine sediment metagenome]